jgi:hypothetical protein
MSTAPTPASEQPIFGGTAAAPAPLPVRHPLGLPAGSVRAIVALLVLGLIWALTLLQEPVPIYLYYLMFLILGHFFAAHGHSIAGAGSTQPSPLHLPRGVVRTLLFLGFVGVFAWRYYVDRDLEKVLDLKQPDLGLQPYLAFVLVGTFFLGLFLGRLVRLTQRGSNVTPYWFQDILAWLSLIAVMGLVVEVLILLVINPGLAPEKRLQLPTWQTWLSAIISFYFGVRS